jgi:hypothetical protein
MNHREVEQGDECGTVNNVVRIIDAAPPSMSACDKLTMDMMINTAAYSKYMSRKVNEQKTQSDETKSERRFYKKRIMDLTKQLIKNPTYTNDSAVINASSAYINACIMHFKFVDLSDTIQSEHQHPDDDDVSSSDKKPQDTDFIAKVSEIDATYLMEDAAKKVKKINIPEKNMLERLFVPPEPPAEAHVSVVSLQSTATTVPRVIAIDFSDQQFKTKGVKKTSLKPKSKPKSNTNTNTNANTNTNTNAELIPTSNKPLTTD